MMTKNYKIYVKIPSIDLHSYFTTLINKQIFRNYKLKWIRVVQ